MIIQNIKNEVIYTSTAKTIKEAIEEAVNKGANLECAYLEGANLGGAFLKGVNLEGAFLKGAKMS